MNFQHCVMDSSSGRTDVRMCTESIRLSSGFVDGVTHEELREEAERRST